MKLKEILKQKRERFHVDGVRTHSNCKKQTGVHRPGKTWADKQKKLASHGK